MNKPTNDSNNSDVKNSDAKNSAITVQALHEQDRAVWEPLARGYKLFYQTLTIDAEYSTAWQRLLADTRFVALGAWHQGVLVGITHAFFHASTWADEVCYLQDLFVDEAARGQGAAAALIEAVAVAARARGAARLYWLTHTDNQRARALYDRVAAYQGFIRYDLTLRPA
jgi:GNAT superfamily N-acetyltransferase